MSQGVVIALLVLAGLLVLRVTNLPPFTGSTAQSPTSSQASPTPLTRSTGYSSGVAVNTSTSDLSPPSNPNSTNPTTPGSGGSTSPRTTQQPPVRGGW